MELDEQLQDKVASPELVTESQGQTDIGGSDLAVGALIDGTYKVIAPLGSGGMSQVYKCLDVTLNRFVAVKLMHAQSTTKKQALLRFQQEGKAIALLKHPNIVEVFALQSTPEGEPYLAMEIVDGIPLSNLIEAQGSLPLSRASKIVSQICAALDHAHSNGVVHRDLKPSNIMIVNPGSEDESVKLLDFGIAKILAPATSIKATQTGEVFGSPAYMSPEQVQGKPVSARSDQYSLGCVVFEMLTGKMPFIADSSFAVMMSHVQEEAPSLAKTANREFPAHVERTVAKMMAKDPDQRFATISDAAKGFGGQTKVENVGKPRFNMRVYMVGLAALAVFLLVFLFTQHCAEEQTRVHSYFPTWTVPGYNPTEEEKDNFPQYVANVPNQQQIVVAQNYVTVTDAELAKAFAKRNPYLQKLSLQDCRTITDNGLKALQNLPNLEELNLGTTTITNACFEHLQKLQKLKKLRLFMDHLTDADMTNLSKIESLEEIDLESNIDLSGAGINKLLNMPHLRLLEVGDTKVTKQDCLQFKSQYTKEHKLKATNFHITFGPVEAEKFVREDHLDTDRSVVNPNNVDHI